MVYVQFNAQGNCRAGAARTTLEIVALKNSPAKTKRRIAAGFVVTANSVFNLTFYKFGTCSVGIIHKGFQCVHPRTETAIIRTLRNTRWHRGEFTSPGLTTAMLPKSENILEQLLVGDINPI